MMNNRLLGAFGEQTAARFLRQKGYDILSANFRTPSGEIDIVAEKDGVICFVEVKTRTEGAILPPSSAVGVSKISNLKSAAAMYTGKYKIEKPRRFDIVEVITDENMKIVSVNHIEHAFS